MADVRANVVVSMPSQVFTMARSFKACTNGKIFIGKIDQDPTIESNQIDIFVEAEDGSLTQISQPVVINSGGFPSYNGQVVKVVAVEGHSMAIYDSYGTQQFYFPNVIKYNPDRFQQEIDSIIESWKKDAGYNLVGGFYSQEGDITTSPDAGLNIDARRGARGQFDVVSQPWEPQAVAGMTFGGTNGRATFLADHRGMVSVSVWYKGKRIQKDVLLPVLQSLGYKSGPDGFQGSILRMGRPDVSPSIIVDYDSNGLPILAASNPHQFGESGPLNPADEGYSYNVYWSRKQTQTAISASIGNFNPYFTYPLPSNDQAANVWVPIATFTTATGTGNANGVFKALLQVSGNVFANNRTYLISGNSRGLSSVSLTPANVNSYFNISALDAPLSDDTNNVNYIVSAGVVQSGNTVTLYLKMPYYTGYSTIQALVIGFPSYVKYNPSSFTSSPSAPAGMVYLTTIKPYTSANVTVKSDGTLVAASPIVRVATDVNKSDRDDITANGFQWSGSGCVNVQSLDYRVVRNSIGDYSIPNAKLALEGWQAQPPRSIFGGDDLAVIEVSEDDSGVNVKVYERKLTLLGNEISVVKGELMDVPMSSWVDIRLFDTQQIIVESDSNE